MLDLEYDPLPLGAGLAAFDITGSDDPASTRRVIQWINEASKPVQVADLTADIDPLVSFHGYHPKDEKYEPYQRSIYENVRLPDAWACTRGSPSVWLGVIDSGLPVDVTNGSLLHPDLQSNRFQYGLANAAGLVQYLGQLQIPFSEFSHYGKDADRHPADDSGHGTQVLGVAAADDSTVEAEGTGVAGVNWESPVYITRVSPLKFENPLTEDNEIDEIKGTAGTYVVSALNELNAWYEHLLELHNDDKANAGVPPPRMVISISLGLIETAEWMEGSFEKAGELGTLIVASIGNDFDDEPPDCVKDGEPAICFPARWSSHDGMNIIAVASVEPTGAGWKPSPFNVEQQSNLITIGAPGTKLATTTIAGESAPDNHAVWAQVEGTSFATPMVAGIASLHWAQNPHLTADGVIDDIKRTGEDVEGVEWRAINAGRLIRCPVLSLFEFLANVALRIRLSTAVRHLFPIRNPLDKLPTDLPDPLGPPGPPPPD